MPFDLALPLDWIVDDTFWMVLLKCLLICPIIPLILGPLGQSTLVPLQPRFQFLAFFPGNPFLALYIASASTLRHQQGPSGMWQTDAMQEFMLTCAFLIYVGLTVMDLKSHYTREQMMGPTKTYHNVLYYWYGYLASAMTIVVVSATVSWTHKLLVLTPGLVWFGCLVKDSAFTSPEALEIKFQTAHAGWNPIWKTRRLLRLTRVHPGVYSYQ